MITPDVEHRWYERDDFIKLREISAAWNLPTSLMQRVGLARGSFVVTGRNMFTWVDPFVSLDANGQPGFRPSGLDPETYANLIVVGVQADFECAASNYNFISALMDGEFIGGQSALALIPYQRRLVRQVNQEYGENDCASNSGLYSPMAVARFVADDAIK